MSRGRLTFVLLAAGSAMAALFACATSDDPSPETRSPVEAGPVVRPPASDGGMDGAALADASYVVPDAAVACAVSPCVIALTGGGSSFCALLVDGTVACWGSNDQGQLGYDSGAGFPLASAAPHRVTSLGGVTEVSGGDGNVCARDADGGIWCWGAADLVGAGIAPLDGAAPGAGAVLTPRRETAVPTATHVAVGTQVACVVLSTGALECWGRNDDRELARVADSPAAPGAVDLGSASVATARPGVSRTFAITSTGALVSWGATTQQRSFGFLLGRDTSEDPDPHPTLVPGLADVRVVATGADHSCAVSGKTVTCWGANDLGQLGRGSFGPDVYLPDITNLAYVVAADDADAGDIPADDVPLDVAVGDGHSCAALGSGRVYCWGTNAGGELGAGVSVAKSGLPHRVLGLSGPAVHVASTAGAACALLRSGGVECWGTNYLGELGSAPLDQNPHPHPRAVTFPP